MQALKKLDNFSSTSVTSNWRTRIFVEIEKAISNRESL